MDVSLWARITFQYNRSGFYGDARALIGRELRHSSFNKPSRGNYNSGALPARPKGRQSEVEYHRY